jgi:hypothetical protein
VLRAESSPWSSLRYAVSFIVYYDRPLAAAYFTAHDLQNESTPLVLCEKKSSSLQKELKEASS